MMSIIITGSHAMGQKQAPTVPYQPASWNENSDPEADATFALDNNDYRLLAFAFRATNVPGILPERVDAYSKNCGLRYMKNFGDTVHSAEDLKRLKQARGYAMRYNAVITSRCRISE